MIGFIIEGLKIWLFILILNELKHIKILIKESNRPYDEIKKDTK